MSKIEKLSYFASDGSVGDASGLTIIDTTDWFSGDFALVESAPKENRPEAARLISDWIESGRNSEEYAPQLEMYGVVLGENNADEEQ
jgi:hypothetical protein